MKKLKWITVKEYVDGDTGEVLTEHEAKKLVLIKTIKNKEIYGKYINDKNGQLYKKFGVVTIRHIYTRTGCQRTLF